MNDMAQVIIPKSDQLNADDLIAGPITVRISGVTIRPGTEQPISIHYEGDKDKPYKACKSMCRVMVTAWGPDSKRYVGRSLTLYRDASVKWGGMDVGGIRISHMSDIDGKLTMALTMTKQSRKPFTVLPLKVSSGASESPTGGAEPVYVTEAQAKELDALCAEVGASSAKLLKNLKAADFAHILASDYQETHAYLTTRREAQV